MNGFFKKLKQKTISIFKHDTSYRYILYISTDGISELEVFNRTNLEPPLTLNYAGHVWEYCKPVGSRFTSNKPRESFQCEFNYRNKSAYVESKLKVLIFCWNANYHDCNNRYSSYEEYLALNCNYKEGARLDFIVNE